MNWEGKKKKKRKRKQNWLEKQTFKMQNLPHSIVQTDHISAAVTALDVMYMDG